MMAPSGGPATDSPTFAEPWQAQIFALVVALHERGLFQWSAFQALLIDTIESAPHHLQGPEFYYRHWLGAAERLFAETGLVLSADLAARSQALAAPNTAAHDHHHP
jgi:nitrile hydratase accessory protein